MANDCIARGELDFWEVCRPLLADPELVHKAAEDRLKSINQAYTYLKSIRTQAAKDAAD